MSHLIQKGSLLTAFLCLLTPRSLQASSQCENHDPMSLDSRICHEIARFAWLTDRYAMHTVNAELLQNMAEYLEDASQGLAAIRSVTHDFSSHARQLVASHAAWLASVQALETELAEELAKTTDYYRARARLNQCLVDVPPIAPVSRRSFEVREEVSSQLSRYTGLRNSLDIMRSLAGFIDLQKSNHFYVYDGYHEDHAISSPISERSFGRMADLVHEYVSNLQRAIAAIDHQHDIRVQRYAQLQQHWSSEIEKLIPNPVIANPVDFLFDPTAFAQRYDAMKREIRGLRATVLEYRTDYLAPLTARRYNVVLDRIIEEYEVELSILALPDTAKTRYRQELDAARHAVQLAREDIRAYDTIRAQEYHEYRVDDVLYYLETTKGEPSQKCLDAQTLVGMEPHSVDAERIYINFMKECLS